MLLECFKESLPITNARVFITICHLHPLANKPHPPPGKEQGLQYVCIPVAGGVPWTQRVLIKCLLNYSSPQLLGSLPVQEEVCLCVNDYRQPR